MYKVTATFFVRYNSTDIVKQYVLEMLDKKNMITTVEEVKVEEVEEITNA